MQRSRIKTTYADGRVEDFNPLLCWRFGMGMAEISLRSTWAVGIMWRWRIGVWSRYRTKFIEIGLLTIYVHYGTREPYNPQTGESYGT